MINRTAHETDLVAQGMRDQTSEHLYRSDRHTSNPSHTVVPKRGLETPMQEVGGDTTLTEQRFGECGTFRTRAFKEKKTQNTVNVLGL